MKIDKNIKKEITLYFKNCGNFFIEVAEDLINKNIYPSNKENLKVEEDKEGRRCTRDYKRPSDV